MSNLVDNLISSPILKIPLHSCLNLIDIAIRQQFNQEQGPYMESV